MAGEKRVLGVDGSDETPSQPTARVKKLERRPQAANVGNDTKVEIKRDNYLGDTVFQCPPISSSRPRSTIQRAGTLPLQRPASSSNHPVRKSETAPNLCSRTTPSTPKRDARRHKPSTSDVGRPRVISISTESTEVSTTDDEAILSSPATNVSTTMSPTFGRRFHSTPPREATPSRSFPAQQGDRGDSNQTNHRCCRSGTCEDDYHQTPAARPAGGNKSSARTVPTSPSKLATDTPGTPARSTTRRGTGHQHTKKVVWGSSSSSVPPPSIQRGNSNPTAHTPRDPSGSRPPPSPGVSSQLTYASDDERPAGGLAHLTGDSDYHTPSSRHSDMSDSDPEPPSRIASSLKRKGKRRASPPPPSSSQDQGSPIQESCSSSPLLPVGSSLNPNSLPGPSHKKRRNRQSRPPSPQESVSRQHSHGHIPAHEPSQAFGPDTCHCAGPCPSCHKPRFPSFVPQFHPQFFHPAYYPHLFLPPPQMQPGYPLSHYGSPSYHYPYGMPQATDPPSISSAQHLPPPFGYPTPTTLATHPSTSHPFSAPDHASPAPAPTPSAPVPAPSSSSPVRSDPLNLGSPPVDPPTTDRVGPELLQALDQFYQPQQRPVQVIDPSYDPRSPYSRKAAVPAFPNR